MFGGDGMMDHDPGPMACASSVTLAAISVGNLEVIDAFKVTNRAVLAACLKNRI